MRADGGSYPGELIVEAIVRWWSQRKVVSGKTAEHIVITLKVPQQDQPAQAIVPRRPHNEKLEHVSLFLKQNIRPSETGTLSIKQLYGRYPQFAQEAGYSLAENDLIAQLKYIFQLIELRCEWRDGDVLVHGAELVPTRSIRAA